MFKFSPYKSCNCRQCRHVATSRRKYLKRQAHRAFRRTKLELVPIACGYKA